MLQALVTILQQLRGRALNPWASCLGLWVLRRGLGGLAAPPQLLGGSWDLVSTMTRTLIEVVFKYNYRLL